jgi:hypothetical protein
MLQESASIMIPSKVALRSKSRRYNFTPLPRQNRNKTAFPTLNYTSISSIFMFIAHLATTALSSSLPK